MKRYSVLVCGVGGGGIISLGMLLKEAAILEGLEVVGSEVRGVAQRGGAVISMVYYGIPEGNEQQDHRSALYSGPIVFGGANLMLAVEVSEGLRNSPFLSKASSVVVNTYALKPKDVEYPPVADIIAELKKITNRVYPVNATEISMERYGSYWMTNAILLGVALACTDIPVSRHTIESLLRSDVERQALGVGINMGG